MNKNRNITLGDIFLDVLAQSQDNSIKVIAERIKAAIKSPEISELVNVCVVNSLGCRTSIKSCIIDTAIDGIISLHHSEIDSYNISDTEKTKEKDDCKCFLKNLGGIIKQLLKSTNQLV